mmetsp:Transcript_19786/g.40130  ORF Transcript_19786/g.40130 Transcript_19786/m.40130 type:complete len:96 (-) Transcript_19786:249-536(-)
MVYIPASLMWWSICFCSLDLQLRFSMNLHGGSVSEQYKRSWVIYKRMPNLAAMAKNGIPPHWLLRCVTGLSSSVYRYSHVLLIRNHDFFCPYFSL